MIRERGGRGRNAGREKEKLAKDLGAHLYIDSSAEDAAAALQRLGRARAILATATSGAAMGPLVSGLSARGKKLRHLQRDQKREMRGGKNWKCAREALSAIR